MVGLELNVWIGLGLGLGLGLGCFSFVTHKCDKDRILKEASILLLRSQEITIYHHEP